MARALWKSVAEFFQRSMWPPGFSSRLSRVLGALSLLRLIELGLTSGFGSVLGLLLEYYDKLLGSLVRPIEPIIKALLAKAHSYIRWPEMLHAHWKHVFVLLGLYVARQTWMARSYGWGSMAINSILGLLVVLTFSVLAGTIPLTSADKIAQFLFVSALVFGAASYALIGFAISPGFVRRGWAQAHNRSVPSWWDHFKWGVIRIVKRSAVGLTLAWAGLQIPLVRQTPSPAVVVSVMLITAFAVYWLLDGIADSRIAHRPGESRRAAYWRSPHTQLGLAMLGPIFWCFVFVVLRAGNVF